MAKIYIIATDHDPLLEPTFVKKPPWMRYVATHIADFDDVKKKTGPELLAIIQELSDCLDKIVADKQMPSLTKPPAAPKLPLDDPFAPDDDPDAWRRGVR